MPSAVTRGRFAWHELMTPDPDAAIRFYRQVVGWGIEQFPGTRLQREPLGDPAWVDARAAV